MKNILLFLQNFLILDFDIHQNADFPTAGPSKIIFILLSSSSYWISYTPIHSLPPITTHHQPPPPITTLLQPAPISNFLHEGKAVESQIWRYINISTYEVLLYLTWVEDFTKLFTSFQANHF